MPALPPLPRPESPIPVRWLLAVLVRLTTTGPARRRAAAVALLAEATLQLRAGRVKAELQGQQQLAGVPGAPVYPPEPRWRARRREA